MSQTFRAIRESRSYRLYSIGQLISLAGTWMQSVAQGWLVLQLTDSATQIGLLAAAQTIPILLLGPAAGVLVDRMDTRRLLLVTQSISAVLALALGLLTLTDHIALWMVYAIGIALGMVNSLDQPGRMAFVAELVGPDLLTNAITLNSVNMNAARAVGPSIAAAVIAIGDISLAFLLNAASFIAVVVALAMIRPGSLNSRFKEPKAKGQLMAGLQYVWRDPLLRTLLFMVTAIGTFTYEFTVSLPAMARRTFHGSASLFGLMTGAMGLGAVIGGLLTAGRPRTGLAVVNRQAAFLGLAVLGAALAPNPVTEVLVLLVVGAASLSFLARGNATVQLMVDPTKRGRVMSLWALAFLGSTPVGAPIIGWIGQRFGVRWALATGSFTALATAGYGAVVARRWRRASPDPDPAHRDPVRSTT
jgi:MFS family permease